MSRLAKLPFFLLPVLAVIAGSAQGSSPEEDRAAFQAYFHERFPNVPPDDFVNGVYAIDAASREQWETIEDFPPYEVNIDRGRKLFETPFANGRGYGDCFDNAGIGIRQNYPYFDVDRQEVITLELAVNECRIANGEKAYKYSKGPLADISAYMSYTSRGNPIDVRIPDDPGAREWYEQGRWLFYAKRGQLNFSCADCHVRNPGNLLRTEKLSPALGQTSHFPVYRSKWGELGTLHRRYAGCNANIRAKPFAAQSREYRALEFFHTYMSNGLELNGPGTRK